MTKCQKIDIITVVNTLPDDSTFDELCEKIAQGKATPSEMDAAFKILNSNIDAFSADVQNQLNQAKK